jgi:hypothetical protein
VNYLISQGWAIDYILQGHRWARLTCPRGGYAACDCTVAMSYPDPVAGSALIREHHDLIHPRAHGD